VGDLPGHEFHGNQWTAGGGARELPGIEAMSNAPWAQENVRRAVEAAGVSPNVRVVVDRWEPDTQLAAYRPDTGELAVNSGATHWYSTDLAAAQAELRAQGIASSDRPEAPIVHELGHMLHHEAVRDLPEWNYRGFTYAAPSTLGGPRVKAMVAHEVSQYAAASNDPREFVAEVFAGVRGGRTYPSEVMKLYKEFHGPRA